MADHFAASAAYADVKAKTDIANSGDKVFIPGNSSATWTTNLQIAGKWIEVVGGSGGGVTTITDGLGGAGAHLIDYTPVAGGIARISNITFNGNAPAQGVDNAILNIHGQTHELRIDNIRFNMNTNKPAISFRGGVCGVIDNCTFNNTPGRATCIFIGHDNWLGLDNYGHGDYSWSVAETFGTNLAVYIEDCFFEWTEAFPNFDPGCPGICDGWKGGRSVMRYNTLRNCVWANHGLESSNRDRGFRQFEIYNNTFSADSGYLASDFIDSRGGCGRVYNNTFVLLNNNPPLNPGFCNDCMRMAYFRHSAPFAPWGQANGTSPWDENTDGQGYRAMDQTGVGRGDLLIDFPSPPTPYNQDRGGQLWPRQEVSPTFIWNNTNSTGKPLVSTGHVLNRDYYLDDPNNHGRPYTAFTYPHPLRTGGLPPDPPADPPPAQPRGLVF